VDAADRHVHARERKVTWLELFFDLVFVAAVSQVGAPLIANYSFVEAARFAFLLMLIWWAWHGYTMHTTRFASHDRDARAATLLQMVAVIFMAANAEGSLDSVSAAGFAAAYAVMRLILVAQYLRATVQSSARALVVNHATGLGAAAVLWLLSSFADPPARYALWTLAVAIELRTALYAEQSMLDAPPHANHLPERFGLFTLILLGEAIVAIMKGIQAQPEWSLAAASTALSGVAFVAAVWWTYFEGAAAAAPRPVQCRADCHRLGVWSAAHLPLYLGTALAALGIEHAIKNGGWHSLHGEEAVLITVSFALAGGALGILRRVRGGHATPAAPPWGQPALLAHEPGEIVSPVAPDAKRFISRRNRVALACDHRRRAVASASAHAAASQVIK
jgi:low temperature requirement protein LtrA